MSRPVSKREIVVRDKRGNTNNVLMTARQEAFFRKMEEADGMIVDRHSLMLELGMEDGSLRVVKCEVAKLVKGYYAFNSIPNGGYQMTQV